MEDNGYRDLLIVRFDNRFCAIEAPSYVANVGDLVEFAPGLELVRCEVVDKMFCTTDSDEYRCISEIATVYPARRIFKCRWEVWEGPEEECGV